MGKAEENKKKKQEALFNTAFDLFTTKGIQNTAISDIVAKAGVGKGTFYLYFKDKYDIRDRLIVHKASMIFEKAVEALSKCRLDDFDEEVIFIADYIIEILKSDKILLKMITKNLSWGVYRRVLDTTSNNNQITYYHIFMERAKAYNLQFINAEVTLFIIVEMIGATCYSAILYEQPVKIDEFKVQLYDSIRAILKQGR